MPVRLAASKPRLVLCCPLTSQTGASNMRYAVLFAFFFASAAVWGANADSANADSAKPASAAPKAGTTQKEDAPKAKGKDDDLNPVHDWREEKGQGYVLF